MLDAGGGSSMYAVQIESLEEFQQKLTGILQSLEQENSVMSMSDGSSSFGSFPEAQAFSSAYEQTKQELISSFNEVTQLVNTMISVVGSNASKYKQTEQDITDKFNSILQQYGDGSTTTGTGTTYVPPATSTTTSTTTTTGTNTGTSTTDDGTTYATQSPSTTTSTSTSTSAGAA
jgi:hypothetical protein